MVVYWLMFLRIRVPTHQVVKQLLCHVCVCSQVLAIRARWWWMSRVPVVRPRSLFHVEQKSQLTRHVVVSRVGEFHRTCC